MVPRAGLEPAQRERRGILNPLCLPIPPPGQRNHCDGNTICSNDLAVRTRRTLTQLIYRSTVYFIFFIHMLKKQPSMIAIHTIGITFIHQLLFELMVYSALTHVLFRVSYTLFT